jgi:hypothetical protein
MKKLLFVIFLSVAGFVGIPVTVAFATTQNVGGGVWDHGVSLATVWSHYYNSTKKHASSACTGADCTRTPKTGYADKGVTTHANRNRPWTKTNISYWSVK